MFLDRYAWDPTLGAGGAKTTVRDACPLIAKYTDSLLSCTAPAGGGVNEVVIVINGTYANYGAGAGAENVVTYTYPAPQISSVALLFGCANESAALLDGSGCAGAIEGVGALTVPFGNGSTVLQVAGSNFGTEAMWSAWASSSCGANASAAGVGLCLALQRRAGQAAAAAGGQPGSSSSSGSAKRFVQCAALTFDGSLFPAGTLRCAIEKFVGASWELVVTAGGLVSTSSAAVSLRVPAPLLTAPVSVLSTEEVS